LKVKPLRYTVDSELLCDAAASASIKSGKSSEIFQKMDPESARATEMPKQSKKAAPALFENSGPSCVELGYCPEGKMKPPECGASKIKAKFRSL
jgi:hypothetical protein